VLWQYGHRFIPSVYPVATLFTTPLNLNQSFASDTITRLKPWLLLMLLVLFIAGAWYAWSGEDTWDDAFISFRYARNLADGYGLVWNPGGEPTQGYTNFLFSHLSP
jgi:hypothetical protein